MHDYIVVLAIGVIAMAKPVLNAPHFQSEPAAFAYVEARLWPNGAICPTCQKGDRAKSCSQISTVSSGYGTDHPRGWPVRS